MFYLSLLRHVAYIGMTHPVRYEESMVHGAAGSRAGQPAKQIAPMTVLPGWDDRENIDMSGSVWVGQGAGTRARGQRAINCSCGQGGNKDADIKCILKPPRC